MPVGSGPSSSFCAHESVRQSHTQITPALSDETTCGVHSTASTEASGAACARSEQMTRSDSGFHTRSS